MNKCWSDVSVLRRRVVWLESHETHERVCMYVCVFIYQLFGQVCLDVGMPSEDA